MKNKNFREHLANKLIALAQWIYPTTDMRQKTLDEAMPKIQHILKKLLYYIYDFESRITKYKLGKLHEVDGEYTQKILKQFTKELKRELKIQ